MMVFFEQPAAYLNNNLIDTLRAFAQEAESLMDLHPEQLTIIYQQQWFYMLVPKLYGGREISFPEVLQTLEALSYADGSVGWVVTLCSGAGWFGGFLDSALAHEVFNSPQSCIAGSGTPSGTANLIKSGYEITGYWNYASGALHATAFTVNCLVQKQGQPLYNPDGTPLVQAFLLKMEEVIFHKTWKAMGMKATGSHSLEVKPITVPQNRLFSITAEEAKITNPLYQYPFLQLAQTTLAVNIAGMAVRFIDLFTRLQEQKLKSNTGKADPLLEVINTTNAQLQASRKSFYDTVFLSWKVLQEEGVITGSVLEAISHSSLDLVHQCRCSINLLFPYGGLEVVNAESEINRVWRNIYTASQHVLLKPQAQ
jgi:indole-3-acetate monooxygenase